MKREGEPSPKPSVAAAEPSSEVATDAMAPLAGRNPRVSVIIPCYNTARFVGKALDSLFAQTYSDYEVIVVDDGSPDRKELELVLSTYGDRVIYIQQENRGPSSARNRALGVARGELVALLDSDDYWHPDYLTKLIGELDRRPELDAIFPDVRIFGDSPEAGWTQMQLTPLQGEITFSRLLAQECFIFIGIVGRKQTLIDAGMFDEDLRSSEDYELWLRILKRGGKIGYSPEVLAFYRKRAESLTANIEGMFAHHSKVWDKVEATMDLSDDERMILHQQRVKTEAGRQLYLGRRAFIAGDYAAARYHFRAANRLQGSFKLRIVILLLHVAPGIVRAVYQARDRHLTRRSAKLNIELSN